MPRHQSLGQVLARDLLLRSRAVPARITRAVESMLANSNIKGALRGTVVVIAVWC